MSSWWLQLPAHGVFKVKLWRVQQGQASQHSSIDEGEAQGTLWLAEELWAGDSCWEEGVCFPGQDACVAVMVLYLHTRMTLDSGL